MSYSAEVLADSPIGYWRLGESSGTNANDLGSGNHDGTYIGGPTFGVAGAIVGDADTAVSFPTTTAPGRYVDVVGWTVVPAQVSLEAWVKGTSFGDNGLIGWYDPGDTYNSFIYLHSVDQIRFYCGDTATSCNYDTAGVLNDNSWHYIVATYDGTNARLYFDNALVAGPVAKTAPGGPSASSFKIGQYGPGTGTAFDGSIDEPAANDYALSAARIAVHYSPPSAPPSGPLQYPVMPSNRCGIVR